MAVEEMWTPLGHYLQLNEPDNIQRDVETRIMKECVCAARIPIIRLLSKVVIFSKSYCTFLRFPARMRRRPILHQSQKSIRSNRYVALASRHHGKWHRSYTDRLRIGLIVSPWFAFCLLITCSLGLQIDPQLRPGRSASTQCRVSMQHRTH